MENTFYFSISNNDEVHFDPAAMGILDFDLLTIMESVRCFMA